MLDYAKLMSWPIAPVTRTYAAKDVILYALGIGTGADMDARDLKYIYEGDGFVALPTLALVLGQGKFWMTEPELGVDWKRILHGEQMLTLHGPIPTAGSVTAIETIEHVFDKGVGKGAVCYVRRDLTDAAGGLLATSRSCLFLRGDGGFGGVVGSGPRLDPVPDDRAPDLVVDLPTRPDLAAIYRLSGDINPLHIDPQAAVAVGFERPILHGLAVYGRVGLGIIQAFCDNDPGRLRRFDVRFAGPLYPGETVRLECWKREAGRISFRATALERGVLVLNNGQVETAEAAL